MALTLYQFPVSHFCEKARFALQFKGVEYRVVNLLPGLHARTTRAIAARSSVPVLVTDDARPVQGSAEIISYLDDAYPERLLTPLHPEQRQQALEWERWLDRGIGVDVRRYCYHHTLPDRRLSIALLGADGPWYGRLYLRCGYRRLERTMRRLMAIDADSAAQSLQRIEAALERLCRQYDRADYLVGRQFSRADLTAAALLAPLFQPDTYGMVWPQPMPAALQATMARLAPRLDWARRLYRDYRS